MRRPPYSIPNTQYRVMLRPHTCFSLNPEPRTLNPLFAFQVRHHQRHVRRRDAADAAGLGERDGADAGQLFAGFGAQVADRGVVEASRESACRPAAAAGRPAAPGGRRSRRTSGRTATCMADLAARSRPARGSCATTSAHSTSGRRSSWSSVTPSTRVVASNCVDRGRSRLPSLAAAASGRRRPGPPSRPSGVSRRSALSCRSSSRILGPAGEHAIRLIDAAGHQVVDQHADVRLVAVEDRAARRRRACSAALTPAISPWAAASS